MAPAAYSTSCCRGIKILSIVKYNLPPLIGVSFSHLREASLLDALWRRLWPDAPTCDGASIIFINAKYPAGRHLA